MSNIVFIEEAAGFGSTLVWSSTDKTGGWTISEGGVRITNSGGGLQNARGEIVFTGSTKRCFALEVITAGAGSYMGFNDPTVSISSISSNYLLRQKNGSSFVHNFNGGGGNGGALANGDKQVFAVSAASRKFWAAVNGVTWTGSGDPATEANHFADATGVFDFVILLQDGDSSLDVRILSGATFPYAFPSGYS